MLQVDKWKGIGRLNYGEAETGTKNEKLELSELKLFNSFSSDDYGITFSCIF